MPAKKKTRPAKSKAKAKSGKAGGSGSKSASRTPKARKDSHKAAPKAGYAEARNLLRELAPLVHPAVQINMKVLTEAIGTLDVEALRRVRRLTHEAIEAGHKFGMEVPPAGQTWNAQNLWDMTPRLRRAAGDAWKRYNDAEKLALSELLHGAMLYGAGRSTGELAGYSDPTVGSSARLHPMMKEFKGLLSAKTKAMPEALNSVLDAAKKANLAPKIKKALKAFYKQASKPDDQGVSIDRESWIRYVPAKWFDMLAQEQQKALYDLGFGAYRYGTEMNPYTPPGARGEYAAPDDEVARTAAGPRSDGASGLVEKLVSAFERSASANDVHPGEIEVFADTMRTALSSRHPKAQEVLHRVEQLLPQEPRRGQDTLLKALGDIIRPVMRRRVIDYAVIDNVAFTMDKLLRNESDRHAVAGLEPGGRISDVVAGWHAGMLSDHEAMQQIAALDGSLSRSGNDLTTGGYTLSTGVNTGLQGPYGYDGRGPFLQGGSRASLSAGVEVVRGSSIPPVGASPF